MLVALFNAVKVESVPLNFTRIREVAESRSVAVPVLVE
jgi:hypothetical protein